MKALSLKVFFIIVGINAGLSQDYHSTYHDVFALEIESATSMHSLNDEEHIILGNGGCENNTRSCLHYYRVNTNGELLNSIQYPDIFGRVLRTSVDSASLYLSGFELDSMAEGVGTRLYKLSYDGIVEESLEYNIPDLLGDSIAMTQNPIDTYIPFGTVLYNDKIIVYGDTREVDMDTGDAIRRGLMVWFNKVDLSYDTMVFIQPLHDRIELWDAEVGPDGMLNVLFDYNQIVSNDIVHYRSFVKYDGQANEVYRWENPPILHDPNFKYISFVVLEDNSIVTYIYNEDHFSQDIIRVSADGNIIWRNRLDPQYEYDQRGILNLFNSDDDNIIGVGDYSSLVDLILSGFIFKVDMDTGNIIWERSYTDRPVGPPSQFELSRNGNLFSISQLSDRSLFLSGVIEREFPNNELWIMHVDEDGCLEADCGGQEQLTIGDPYFSPMMHDGAIWYYQNPSAEVGIVKQTFFRFSLGSGMARTEQFLDLRNDFIYEDINRINFYVTDDNREYYLLSGEDTILVYDFNLEEGDLFESAYTPNTLRVIETDTLTLTNNAKRQYWILACEDNPDNTLTWIEELGTYHGVLWPSDFCSGDYGDELLNCFFLNEQLYHINPNVPDCLATVSSVVDEQAINPIVVFPNPVSDDLHAILSESGSYDYSIINLNGMKLLSGSFTGQSLNVDVSSFNEGMYFVRIKKDNRHYLSKFIKTN